MRREPEFEESADMRLVELHRAALGRTKPEVGAWKTATAPDGPPVEAEDVPEPQGAVLALELTAAPSSDVIPGAIVTLALSIANEGYAPANGVRVGVPLPGGAAFRNGSLVRNGQPMLDDVADELFDDGLRIGTIAPRSRVTLVWKIGVRLGNKPLVITPTATAEDAAVVGAATTVISRREGSHAAFGAEVQHAASRELPIYELDEEETLEHEAAEAALSPVIAPDRGEYQPPIEPPTPMTPPPAQPEPTAPPDQPMPSLPEQPPDVEPAAREAVVLYGRIDRPSIAYFDRSFNGARSPTLLDHFLLAGALACAKDARGTANLEHHLDAQRQLLGRIVLHEKLGKTEPIEQYAGEMLARLDELTPTAVVPRDPLDDRNAVLLETELDEPALAMLEKMQREPARWDFIKARQFTLALLARRVIARGAAADTAEDALRVYAHACTTHLQRLFVRMRLDRTTALLFAGEELLDAAARRVVAALSALF